MVKARLMLAALLFGVRNQLIPISFPVTAGALAWDEAWVWAESLAGSSLSLALASPCQSRRRCPVGVAVV